MPVSDQNNPIKILLDKTQYNDDIPARRHRPDYLITLFMGLLMLLGLIIIYAIGPQRANVLNNAYGSEYSDSYFFIKQVGSLIISLIAFAVMTIVPYSKIIKYAGKLVLFSLGACLLLFLASLANLDIAQGALGATRWFNLGILGSFQPAEMLKFSILIFVAVFLGRKIRQGKLNNIKETLIPLAIITAISMFFVIVVQKDLGTGISMTSIIAIMLFVGGLNKRNMGMILSILAVAGVLLIMSAPHRMDRIATYLKGDNTSVNDEGSYHIEHAKLAIGSGGIFGVGIGNSVEATGYLPEAINDSVFAIMGETFGFVGLVTILALFGALLMRLLKVMDHLLDIKLRLLIAGTFGWFGSHVILNVASMIGIFPLTGITLPLLSFGGTSMMFISASLGLAFQLSGYTVHSSRLKEAKNENFNNRRGIGRSRYTSRSSITRN